MKKKQTSKDLIPDRSPAVAGSFYPGQSLALKNDLQEAFVKASCKAENKTVVAIISPHAGYVYSAKVAASAFNQIDRDKKYDHIFIIGSSHRMAFNGASVYPGGNFITPLGPVPVDSLASTISHEPGFTDNIAPHLEEHSLEVQIPFLQYILKKPFSIIPIIIGSQDAESCKKIARTLAPYLNEHNLFVISSDFSHYPQYEDAKKSDLAIADAITKNSASNFLKVKQTMEDEGTPNLLTGICGWTSVLTLLDITEGNKNFNIRKVDYQNSGDARVGDKSRVVGYVALAVDEVNSTTKRDFVLTEKDKEDLLSIARNTLSEYVINKKVYQPDKSKITKNLQQQAGAFVTLTKKGDLRGCIGTFKPSGELYKTIRELAISAASKDYRFDPVSPAELESIEIEISVLTPLKKINSIDEIEIGKHGIYIIQGNRSGTLLPQVPEKYGWSREEFLGYCARDKAGIGWNGWKDAEIYTYEAIIFSEKEFEKHTNKH